MKEKCDLKVHINGQHTFFLNQRILCSYSGRLKKMVLKSKRDHPKEAKMMDFPGGPHGFELVSRFCYSGGKITMSPSNISILHSSAHLLEMTDEFSHDNLLSQSEAFLDGLLYWTWDDTLTSLKTCGPFFSVADSSGLIDRLLSSLLIKISAQSESPPFPSSPSFSSSPDTPYSIRQYSGKEWWFDDLTALPPAIIGKILTHVGAHGADNENLTLTRFLLHYLKAAGRGEGYAELADTAVHGVVLIGRAAFSCRGLFWVMRVVSCSGVSRECRRKLERAIGVVLDSATLDDLLVVGSGNDGGVYDVGLVVRLVRVFVVAAGEGGVFVDRMKKVGRLVDKYLREISPDQGLKVARFLGVAESLPDSARDCFDGVYRALDIYLESHPMLSSEERETLCRCLNYEKLTLETCKDLAKNPRTPPFAAMQALVSQKSKLVRIETYTVDSADSSNNTPRGAASTTEDEADTASTPSSDELKISLQKMQNKVIELEEVCMEMKSQMSSMVKGKHGVSGRGMTRFC